MPETCGQRVNTLSSVFLLLLSVNDGTVYVVGKRIALIQMRERALRPRKEARFERLMLEAPTLKAEKTGKAGPSLSG